MRKKNEIYIFFPPKSMFCARDLSAHCARMLDFVARIVGKFMQHVRANPGNCQHCCEHVTKMLEHDRASQPIIYRPTS